MLWGQPDWPGGCDVWCVCGVGGGGGSAPPFGALWRRCRALRPTHSAGRPTEGPLPTPWSKNPQSASSPARRPFCALPASTGDAAHAAASRCAGASRCQVRSSPARLLGPDRCSRILRRVAPDQLALHLHLVPAEFVRYLRPFYAAPRPGYPPLPNHTHCRRVAQGSALFAFARA